jgi:hypothetical protein
VEAQSVSGLRAPSFYVETATAESKNREKAEQEAIKLAKEKSGLSRFPETWKFSVVHLEDRFEIDGRWVKQGIYRMNERGQWQKNH